MDAGSDERPPIVIAGERVALRPLRRELLPTDHAWSNDVATTRTYALPLPTVEGVIRISRAELMARLGAANPVIEYGGQSYHFRHLGEYLGLGASRIPEEQSRVSVILVRAGEHSTALITDEMQDSREIVVKPVGPQLATIRGIAGATILGDGRIAVILDMGILVRTAKPAARPAAKRPASRARSQANPRTSAPTNAVPNGIGLVLHHLDFTTHAQDEVRRFYVDVLGFSQSDFDAKQNYLFVQTAPGASIGFMPPMPGPPEDWRPPREPAIYFFVRDVDRAYRELSARGVSFDGEEPAARLARRVRGWIPDVEFTDGDA